MYKNHRLCALLFRYHFVVSLNPCSIVKGAFKSDSRHISELSTADELTNLLIMTILSELQHRPKRDSPSSDTAGQSVP